MLVRPSCSVFLRTPAEDPNVWGEQGACSCLIILIRSLVLRKQLCGWATWRESSVALDIAGQKNILVGGEQDQIPEPENSSPNGKISCGSSLEGRPWTSRTSTTVGESLVLCDWQHGLFLGGELARRGIGERGNEEWRVPFKEQQTGVSLSGIRR